MNGIIDAAFSRTRVVMMTLLAILAVGAVAYRAIPKEATPDIPIPIIYVVTTLEGISPEDSERMLVKPLESELSTLTGLKKITASAGEGVGSVTMEFEPGFDADAALDKVREAVDRAKADLPEDASDPSVNEVNTAMFPIITAVLSGPVPERSLNRMATELAEAIEGDKGVLEVDVSGDRSELLEVEIDPTTFETYNISFDELIGSLQRNNRLVAAGAIESGAGRLVLKVPGLIKGMQDVMDLPVKTRGSTVVTFGDVAKVRRTFEDPDSFARINGQPALALDIKKRSGANIIETVEAVKAIVAEISADYPESVQITFLQDQSAQVKSMLTDLEANVIAAVLLVMVVVVWALGLRASILVGLSIPGAFLAGVAGLWMMGYTMNIVVLFSLILVVGMLVDGAIVTVELADRRLHEGDTPREAYAHAAKRMAWPIIASTITTLSVFLPLLFWNDTVGQFMKFLPITVLMTLSASLLMALIFIPVLGGVIGRKQPQSAKTQEALYAAETGDPRKIGGFTGAYVRLLAWTVQRPWATLLYAIALLLGAFGAYGQFGKGTSFFPDVEPDFMTVSVRGRDNYSVFEADALVRIVEDRLLQYDSIKSVYAKSGQDRNSDEEVLGNIQLELTDWDTRPTAALIADRIRSEMAVIPGIEVQAAAQDMGPGGGGKPVSLKVLAKDGAAQEMAVTMIRAQMETLGGFVDITDTRPLPGVEWSIIVDRSKAARAGADVSLLGQAVQLLTRGITVADYRPDYADGTVDIRVRFPSGDRTLEKLRALRVPTSAGLVPIANFVSFEPVPRSGAIKRTDQSRVITIDSDVAPGLLVSDKITELQAAIDQLDLPEGATTSFGGEAEDQQAAMIFLVGAFVVAIVMMFAALVTQFNSFWQATIVMSAIIFSIAGVLIGLMVTGRPFGIVMGGIAVIALAGIVVNNNIVLIDTYNSLRREGQSPYEAAIRTGAQRLRPVLLTSVTTALGLMPMVIGVNINFYEREIIYGAPSTQWWTEMSTAIAGGLMIATVLTLLVTPALLMIREKRATRHLPTGVVPAPAE